MYTQCNSSPLKSILNKVTSFQPTTLWKGLKKKKKKTLQWRNVTNTTSSQAITINVNNDSHIDSRPLIRCEEMTQYPCDLPHPNPIT